MGSLMLDPEPETGEQVESAMEFARFCIPRRTYTQSHLDYVACSMHDLLQKVSTINGFRIVRQAKVLRHFTAQLEPVPLL